LIVFLFLDELLINLKLTAMPNVDLSRVPEYYHRYINQVTEHELDAAFQQHQTALVDLLTTVPPETWDHRYAEGKWTIKEVVQHIIDAERVFTYRALRFARKDPTALPGFDENIFASSSKADKRKKEDLLDELKTVQRSSAQLFGSFDEEQLGQSGTASGQPVSVEGIGFIIVGHARHHKKILEERYLK
jgi:uncharacterized damage-inducible protein DinB